MSSVNTQQGLGPLGILGSVGIWNGDLPLSGLHFVDGLLDMCHLQLRRVTFVFSSQQGLG
ncbi:hypothetical protein D3C75_1309210 [compost metagenome]